MMKGEENKRNEIQPKEVDNMKRQPVLIVEDENIMRESLRDWLADSGYEVTTAEDGEQALQMLGEQEFGVAVLDLKLPGKDGVEVLKEATNRQPNLKGIIITAYPSVETAVEAMKYGATDYLVKPVSPDELEDLIQKTLGPVQAEIRPQPAAEEAVETETEAAEVEQPAVEEEVPSISEAEAPAHMQEGKNLLKAGRFDQAKREFQAVISVQPGNLEARQYLRQAKEEVAKSAKAAEARPEVGKPCVWMKLGLVSYRMCNRDYDCFACEFDQMMQERLATEEAEVDKAVERLKELPGNQRVCRYALKGEVAHRTCSHLFNCAQCEFNQMMEDAFLQKLTAEQEALRKKKDSWWWSYWS